MKKYFIFIIVLSGFMPLVSRVAAQNVIEEKFPEFLFEQNNAYDFGDVPEGPNATHVFAFLNKGNKPLIIENVAPACGCTVAAWTKEPILPGKKGSVTVTYDTEGRVGPFKKEFYIKANVKDAVELQITGMVKAKEPELPATGH